MKKILSSIVTVALLLSLGRASANYSVVVDNAGNWKPGNARLTSLIVSGTNTTKTFVVTNGEAFGNLTTTNLVIRGTNLYAWMTNAAATLLPKTNGTYRGVLTGTNNFALRTTNAINGDWNVFDFELGDNGSGIGGVGSTNTVIRLMNFDGADFTTDDASLDGSSAIKIADSITRDTELVDQGLSQTNDTLARLGTNRTALVTSIQGTNTSLLAKINANSNAVTATFLPKTNGTYRGVLTGTNGFALRTTNAINGDWNIFDFELGDNLSGIGGVGSTNTVIRLMNFDGADFTTDDASLDGSSAIKIAGSITRDTELTDAIAAAGVIFTNSFAPAGSGGGSSFPLSGDVSGAVHNITNLSGISGGGTPTNAVKVNGVKVFRALVTQVSVLGSSATYGGVLTVGHTYRITTLQAGDDFSNVGYVSDFTPFVATASTPAQWTNNTEVQDMTASTPVAIVLENTLGGTVVWSYASSGRYTGTLAGAFPLNKVFFRSYSFLNSSGGLPDSVYGERTSDDTVILNSFMAFAADFGDDVLSATPVEILVYP